MPELFVLCLFAAALVACVASGLSILWALAAGYVIFFCYGLYKRHSPAALFRMTLRGVRTIRELLPVFLLIGVMTGVWRQCGTIAFIVYEASALIRPEILILSAFLLCSLLSILTGTAFGTVATMGVICAAIASAAGMSTLWVGGAILAGCFVGDRCSPMSTSALLVSELTGTEIYDNIKNMLKTGALPFLLSCALYLAVGFLSESGPVAPEVRALLAEGFSLRVSTVLPAALIVLLALCRVRVIYAMTASILAGALVSLLVQDVSLMELARCFIMGYRADSAELAAMMDGGGLISMASTTLIVCLSSSYAGIFDGTGLLSGLKERLDSISGRITPCGAVTLAALITSFVSCNQTLASILTAQLCADSMPDKRSLALAMEDTVIVMAPLVPWSIAAAVPLATIGAGSESILTAPFLYLLPVFALLKALIARRRAAKAQTT